MSIDHSAGQPRDKGKYAEKVRSEVSPINLSAFGETSEQPLSPGTRVFWRDPAAEQGDDASGFYEVAEDDGETVLLRDHYGDISNEAFRSELTLASEMPRDEDAPDPFNGAVVDPHDG